MSSELSAEDMPRLARRFFAGERDALGEIARRYYPKMRAEAADALGREPALKMVYEPDEAVDDALRVMMFAVASGEAAAFAGFAGFWRLFPRTVVEQIAAMRDHEAARKRGGQGIPAHGRKRPNGSAARRGTPAGKAHARVPDDVNHVESKLLPAETYVMGNEVIERLFELLGPALARVAHLRLDGSSIPEIAAELGISTRSIDRRLEEIRMIWGSSGLLDALVEC